jgi:hypothetical protein
MRDDTGVTGGKSIVVVSVVNPLVAFYDIHGTKGNVQFFCSMPDTTRDLGIEIFNMEEESDN